VHRGASPGGRSGGRVLERRTPGLQGGWREPLAEMAVGLTDGSRLAARHDSGIPADDIAAQGRRLATKFDALVEPVLGGPRTRELREMALALDDIPDIGQLARLAAE